MRVQAEFSLYPLRTPRLADSIDSFVDHLQRSGLAVEVGAMSSRVEGDSDHVMRALGDAFRAAAGRGDIVLTVKLSNACPSRASGQAFRKTTEED